MPQTVPAQPCLPAPAPAPARPALLMLLVAMTGEINTGLNMRLLKTINYEKIDSKEIKLTLTVDTIIEVQNVSCMTCAQYNQNSVDTVKPLHNGHFWDGGKWPLNVGIKFLVRS